MARGERFQVATSAPRGRAGAVVGASIWQTPGGVQAELRRINDDILVFSAEIAAFVQARDPAIALPPVLEDRSTFAHVAMGPYADFEEALRHQINDAKAKAAQAIDLTPKTTDPSRAKIAAFFTATWVPFVKRWISFFESNKGWTDNVWWNHAPEAEQFADQLVELRATAIKLGMPVQSPKPAVWSKSALDPSNNLNPLKPLGDLFDLAKFAIYGGLGLLGVVAITSLVTSVRKGTDPTDNYMRLMGGAARGTRAFFARAPKQLAGG
jgi:hypothetical protein